MYQQVYDFSVLCVVLKKGEKRSGGKDKKDKKSTNKGEREKVSQPMSLFVCLSAYLPPDSYHQG